MRSGVAGAIGLVTLVAFPRGVSAQSAAAESVWVNTSSGVYHCAGSPVYKNTRRGALMPEGEARERGHRPAGGVECAPRGVGVKVVESAVRGARSAEALPLRTSPQRGATAATCEVTRVIDGDTFECAPLGGIRPIGIDAPEMSQEPFGSAAKAALSSFLPVGTTVALESDRTARDRNGRTLAYVWVGDVMINWQMVRMGWTMAYRYPPDVRYADELDAASSAASTERRGLWAIGGFECAPAARRRKEC